MTLGPSPHRPQVTRCSAAGHFRRAMLAIVTPGRTPVARWPHEPGHDVTHDATCPTGDHGPCLCGIGAR